MFCTWSLQWSQAQLGCQFVGIVTRTVLCADKKRTEVLEEHLTVERELASIVTDHGEDFQLEEGSEMKI